MIDMRKLVPWFNESNYLSPLSPGCRMCAQGAKMVVLITGLCSDHCYYCPLSLKKIGKDVIYADEWQLKNEKETQILLKEAYLIRAKGAGITGGDPLLVWKRVHTFITLLKKEFGPTFHIHLYTSGTKNLNHIQTLIKAGLDEIRFHPSPQNWTRMEKTLLHKNIKQLVQTDCDIALEIPVIPNKEKEIIQLITWANTIGLKWINLNELEYSESNAEALNTLGFTIKNSISAAVQGSQECAYYILKSIKSLDYQIGVHYCSVSFKDGIQLTNRIKRRAHSIAQPQDIITEEGTLLKGVIYPSTRNLNQTLNILLKTYDVPKKYIRINEQKKRIEIASWILETIADILKKNGYRSFIVEEYPTADHLEVERIPLPL